MGVSQETRRRVPLSHGNGVNGCEDLLGDVLAEPQIDKFLGRRPQALHPRFVLRPCCSPARSPGCHQCCARGPCCQCGPPRRAALTCVRVVSEDRPLCFADHLSYRLDEVVGEQEHCPPRLGFPDAAAGLVRLWISDLVSLSRGCELRQAHLEELALSMRQREKRLLHWLAVVSISETVETPFRGW